MKSLFPYAAVLASLLGAPVLAGGITTPSGFNVESNTLSAPIGGVLLDGTVLLSVGSFGDDRLAVLHEDGAVTLFATGIGALAGVAQSPVTGDIVVGDSFGADPLLIFRDLNGDGDALDFGERTVFPVTLPPTSNGSAILPFDLTFKPGTDELYVSGSTPFGIAPLFGGVVRISDGSAATFAEDGFSFSGGMAWDSDVLYVADLDDVFFTGRVVRLHDGNDDGDAMDSGEQNDFASFLTGASGLVQAADGSFYLSGTFAPDFSSASVTRLSPDTDGDLLSDAVDQGWSTGWSFTGGLTLHEGPGGLTPGATGDGALTVTDFGAQTIPIRIRSAPLAQTALNGSIGSFSTAEIVVGGAPGAAALWVLSLDQTTATVYGIGDICVGFGGAHLISQMLPIGPSGEAVTLLHFPDLSEAAGLPFTLQGFTFEDGDVGIGNPVESTATL